jgi:trans-2,3-dihydro-3-hydroxyanthranilate isomerase
MAQRFHMVDVFAERRYVGNQLAVVVGPDYPSDGTMQEFTAEMNYSETAFVRSEPDDDGGYGARVFTPEREIAFAGHPILGAAWVVRQHFAPKGCQSILMNLMIGQIPVTFGSSPDGREIAWFRGPSVLLGKTCHRDQIAIALGISEEDIDDKGPVQQLSAGTSVMMVPLRSLEALRRSRLNIAAFAPLAARGFPPLVYLFCAETHSPENDLCARFFFNAHGVREDAATGNGAAFLGTYLLEHRLFAESRLSLRIEQGHEVRRPSLILLDAQMSSEGPVVNVGGGVISTVQGELL